MKLIESLNQHEVVLAIAERINVKYPDAFGRCSLMAEDLAVELKKHGIPARHVMGQFQLDEPTASKYTDGDNDEPVDEYLVDHDWVTVEGKILDVSTRQFKRDVNDQIPDVVFIDYTSPLFLRYNELGEV